ncbi:Myb-binding protein 1A-like protein [Nymphon striatum]|nr:Myb-binding protein 1A-like protein [Nymphon striatum]
MTIMDDEEQAMESVPNATVNSKTKLLEKFWELAEPDDSVRISGAEDLLVILKNSQYKDNENKCEELTYTVQRLIRGLSSQRKAARLGFYITLCQILKEFPIISFEETINLINKHLVVKGSKQDQSNLIIGQAFAYGAIIRSGRLSALSGNNIANMLASLLLLEKQKSFTKPMITKLIVELFKQIKEKKFKKYLWPKLEESIKDGWENCNSETFMLLLNIHESFPDVIDKSFLKTHWQTGDIFAVSNHSRISKIIIESTAEHPSINPVCFKILHRAMKQPLFDEFWHNVIDEQLFGSRKEKLGFLGFEIIKEAINTVENPKHLDVIISPNFLHLLITSASNSHLFLNSAAKNICEYLVQVVKSTDNYEIQWQIVMGLCKEPSSVLFDRQSHTKTLIQILMNLSPKALRNYFEMLKEKFLGNNNEPEVLREFVIKQIANLMTHSVILKDVEWRTEILQFLLFHAFFSVEKPVPEIAECAEVAMPMNDKLKQAVVTSFQHAVELLTKLGQRWKPHVVSYLQVLLNLVKFADKLINNPDVTFTNFDVNEIQETWNHTLNEIIKLEKKSKTDIEPNSAANSFQVLYLYLLLQLFVSPNKTIEIIEEVEECCKHALKKQRKKSVRLAKRKEQETENKAAEPEPEWVNVVIDILLSMLSQGNKLARIVVDNVFCLICPHMTEEALQQILDVI